MAPRVSMQVAGVRLTNPDKVLWPEQGITKRELAEYYLAVADRILPHLDGRPLTLLRCPAGREKACFVQRRVDEGFPRALRRVSVPEEGGSATYAAAESIPALVALVQLGALEIHTWGSRKDRLDRPDRVVIDLDPGPDAEWQAVVTAALDVRGRLDELGLRSFVKTTGGKGLHVVAPLVRRHGWDEVKAAARAIAVAMARDEPRRYVAQAAKQERVGRIFVDYLRNGWSASVVSAYSPRARPGAPVSTPVSWQDLEGGLDPASLTVATVPARLRSESDAWSGYAELRQSLTKRAWQRIEARR